MFAVSLLLSFSFLSLAASQSNDPALQIKAIKAHFTQAEIVPSLLSSFDPSAVLVANFAGVGDITPGQPLTKDRESYVVFYNHLSLTSSTCRVCTYPNGQPHPSQLIHHAHRKVLHYHGRCGRGRKRPFKRREPPLAREWPREDRSLSYIFFWCLDPHI
jgi:hypothetical protein